MRPKPTAWNDERVWGAVDAWRWIPPAARRLTTQEYDLAVTPGSYALTYVYGFRAGDGPKADAALDRLREQIESLGGTGARLQVTPRTEPSDLTERLLRRGYRPLEEAEVLVWELLESDGRPRLPEFPPPEGILVREVKTSTEYEAFLELSTAIFGDPPPSAESLRAFKSEFHRNLQGTGHSDRFLAWEGPTPVGRAGLEIVGPVARFWGTGVLTQHRRRGIYGALVRARCEDGVARGAEVALVSARTGTSGPILKHHGFRPVGSIRIYEVRW
jgi:hypothetical protein